jgi:fluoride ion exporter CrcB/FEX
MNSDFKVILAITIAGAIGGLINAFLSDNGFVLPKQEVTSTGFLWRPGYLGNILVSTAAAIISWGLYGPYSTYVLIAGTSETAQSAVKLELSIANLVGALLVGVAGSRWLTSEVDKNLMKATVTAAVATAADPAKAASLVNATPSQALQIVKKNGSLPPLPDQP